MQVAKGDSSSRMLLARVMVVHIGATITLAVVISVIFMLLGNGKNSCLLLLSSPIYGFITGSMKCWYLKRKSTPPGSPGVLLDVQNGESRKST
nr:unnamed protein product [uncultured bacterium]